MIERERLMPSDDEINAACNEDDSQNYQPGETSFVTTVPLVRALVRSAVERALAEQESKHKRELIEAKIACLQSLVDASIGFPHAPTEGMVLDDIEQYQAELAALDKEVTP